MRNAQATSVIHRGHSSEFLSTYLGIKDLRHSFAVYLFDTIKEMTQKS